MPSWNDLQAEFHRQSDADKGPWLDTKQTEALQAISRARSDRHVILYGSAWLQKPAAPAASISIQPEDLNGFMSIIFGMDWSKGLTLIIHTPGGVTNATESVVAYLRSKFTDIEVIVPSMAMSAGTMISLSCNRIIMGRQSQLGPIDPQMFVGGRQVSAQAIVEQFNQARQDILANVASAHVWAPILQSLGPALLVEAKNALTYSESMVAGWLSQYMFPGDVKKGEDIAAYFNDANTHKSHGRRIDRDEARRQGVLIEDLETDQQLQDSVLTSYHLFTLLVEQSLTSKVLASDTGRRWMKNYVSPEQQRIIAESQNSPPAALPNRAARRGSPPAQPRRGRK